MQNIQLTWMEHNQDIKYRQRVEDFVLKQKH